GCSHGCIYCYAPDVLRMDNGEEWGSFVDTKEGLANILAKELKRMAAGVSGHGEKGRIGLGTVTDPYQSIESGTKNTRYCLEQIFRKKWPVCVQTKSDLITRDIDILAEMEGLEVAITITTLDEEIATLIEPGASSPERRLAAMEELVGAGIKTWVFLGPIIPTVNDSEEELTELLNAIHGAGIRKIQYDRLRIKPMLRERMGLVFGNKMEDIAHMANDPKWFARISNHVEKTCKELGITSEKAF
ncbi:MAG: radical SAM protein, partial [Thermoplasmata archaeon]|nr:radical SAM protein [Thermoplasmata archaeon]